MHLDGFQKSHLHLHSFFPPQKGLEHLQGYKQMSIRQSRPDQSLSQLNSASGTHYAVDVAVDASWESAQNFMVFIL